MDTRTTRSRHPHNTTIAQLVESYLNHAENTLARVTYASYATSLRLFVAHAGPETPARDITDLQIVRWMRARLAAGRSPNTVRSDHRRLRYGFFSWAVERGYVARNWAALAKPPEEAVMVPRSVGQVEFGRLLLACAGAPTEHRDKALLCLLWDTGMRIGELGRLTRADVRLGSEEMFVTLPAAITKTHSERVVPFTTDCRAALYDYIAFERGELPGPFFQSSRTGGQMAEQTAKHIVRKLGERAGVAVGAHDFRRAFVERMQREGMPDTLIMELTGHRTQVMLRLYGRGAARENAILAYRRATAR